MHGELRIETAQVIAMRVHDVAFAIDLAEAERLIDAAGYTPPTRGRLASAPSKAIAFDTPPLVLTLPPIERLIGGQRHSVAVSARIYDFGVVSLTLRYAADQCSWPEFVQRFAEVNADVGPDGDEGVWNALLVGLRQSLAPALIRPADTHLQEEYLVACVGRLSEPLTAAELLDRVDVLPLLTGETRPLSDAARRELLRRQHSYYADDLVLLTWDRALIVEPRGETDVLDVLEVANAQLLEMRYYDELLDDELPRMYDRVEEARQLSGLGAPRRYADLARRLHGLVAEVTELTERVDNALQVVEDVYLARVYGSALELFRVPKLAEAVDRKLAIIRDTYTALYEEASARRGVVLEVTIVLLILLELVLALVRH